MHSKDSRVYLIKSEEDLNRLYDDIERELVHGPIEVTWGEYVPKRTLAQNRLMWAYYTDIGKQIGHTSNEVHLYYRSKFLQPRLVTVLDKTFMELPSTTELSTKDMVDYLTQIEIHAAEHGYQLSAPYFRELALYGEK